MGILYVCGTPIGNLEDVSIRLLKTLRKVDLIACEDTRQTVKLLNRYRIKTKLFSYHEHSGRGKEDYLLNELKNGKNIALVSDAGMPTISDPGRKLIERTLAMGLGLEVIPGPSAVISSLALSGMDGSAFVFAGFLPSRSSKRREELKRLAKDIRPVIIYEAPHRLMDILQEIEEIMGSERIVAVARELTKKHEEIRRGEVRDMVQHFRENPPRGEICVLIAPGEILAVDKNLDEVAREIEQMIESGIDKKEAFKMKAREYNIKKSDIYKYFVEKSR